jgi:hypothetical protein
MNINKDQTHRGFGHILVTIDNIAADRPVSDDMLAGFAMASVGENPSSLFGWAVSRSTEFPFAVVRLNTD